MIARRLLLACAAVGSVAFAGCGWAPLYADRETEPASAELRAIRVQPIAERIGQRLELGLRDSLNSDGEPTPQRYVLRTALNVSQQDLDIQSQGLGTIGKIDVSATYTLADLKTGAALLSNTTHVNERFTIDPNGYTTVVAQDDARTRAVEELRMEIVSRLTVFMQRRAAQASSKPS